MTSQALSSIADIAPVRMPDRVPRSARGDDRFELPRDEPVREKPGIDEQRDRGTGYESGIAETRARERADDRTESRWSERPSRVDETRTDRRAESPHHGETKPDAPDAARDGSGETAGATTDEGDGEASRTPPVATNADGSSTQRKNGTLIQAQSSQIQLPGTPVAGTGTGGTATEAAAAQTQTATPAATATGDGKAPEAAANGGQATNAPVGTGAPDAETPAPAGTATASGAAATGTDARVAGQPSPVPVNSPDANPAVSGLIAATAGTAPQTPTTGEAGRPARSNASLQTAASAPAQSGNGSAAADPAAGSPSSGKANGGKSQGDAAAVAAAVRSPDQTAAQLLASAPPADPGTASLPAPAPAGGATPSFHAEMRAALDAPTQGAAATARAATTALPPAEQVALQISRAVDQTGDKLTVHLKPAELGKVTIELDVGPDHRVTAVISAERSETLDLLQRDAKALERALNDAGLKTDSGSLEFSLQGREEHASEGDADNRSNRAALLTGADSDNTGTGISAAYRPVILPDGRVDIQV